MTDKLTSDLIGDPNIWRMAMLISDDALDVVAYSTVEDNSMLYRHIPLDTAAADRVKALAVSYTHLTLPTTSRV